MHKHKKNRSAERPVRHLKLVSRNHKPATRVAKMPRIKKRAWAKYGAMGAGAAGILLADLIGVGEIAFGVFSAYVVYRVLRYGVSPTQANRVGGPGGPPLTELDVPISGIQLFRVKETQSALASVSADRGFAEVDGWPS